MLKRVQKIPWANRSIVKEWFEIVLMMISRWEIEIRARSRLTDWCLLAFSPQFTPFEVGKNFFNPSITDSSHFRFSFLATLGTLGANPICDKYFDHPLYLKTHNYGFWKGFGEIFFFLYSKLLVMFVCKVFQNICKSHLPQNIDWQIKYWDKIEEGDGLFFREFQTQAVKPFNFNHVSTTSHVSQIVVEIFGRDDEA